MTSSVNNSNAPRLRGFRGLALAILVPLARLRFLLVLGAIFIFNAAWRFIPAFGLVALGLIHAGYMLVPNVELKFLWPVWLAILARCTRRMHPPLR